MNASQLLNDIIQISDEELATIRQVLKPGSKSRALFDYISHCAEHFEVCTNEGAVRSVYGLNRGDDGYRKAYLSLMRLIEQVSKRCTSLRKRNHESQTEALLLSKRERVFVVARSLARNAKWSESLHELRKLETERMEDTSEEEFAKAQRHWLMFVASAITDSTAYNHNHELQSRLRDTAARALLHACFIDLVAVELKEVQRIDSKVNLRNRCERIGALKQLPMLAKYQEVIEYFILVLVSGYYTVHKPRDASPYQQQMLRLNERMLAYGFSFITTSVGGAGAEDSGDDTDTLYTKALEFLSARDFLNAAGALESFIKHIQGQPDMYARFVNVLLECYLSIGEVSKAIELTLRFGEAMDRYGNPRNQVYASVLQVRAKLYDTKPPASSLFRRVVDAEIALGDSIEIRELLLRLKAKYFFLTRDLDGLDLIYNEVARIHRRGGMSQLSCEFVKGLRSIVRAESHLESKANVKSKISKAITTIRDFPNAAPDYLLYWLDLHMRSR